MADRLAELLQDPAQAAKVPADQAPAVLAELARAAGALDTARAILVARLVARGDRRPEPSREPDRLLSPAEAAAIAHVSPKWLYRRANAIPGVRRLGPRTLRFEEAALRRWLAARRP